MTEAALMLLLTGAIDVYAAYRERGWTDAVAKAKAIEDNMRRFREGDADLTAALEGKPAPVPVES